MPKISMVMTSDRGKIKGEWGLGDGILLFFIGYHPPTPMESEGVKATPRELGCSRNIIFLKPSTTPESRRSSRSNLTGDHSFLCMTKATNTITRGPLSPVTSRIKGRNVGELLTRERKEDEHPNKGDLMVFEP